MALAVVDEENGKNIINFTPPDSQSPQSARPKSSRPASSRSPNYDADSDFDAMWNF
jgi:hypothetical protein